MDQQKGSDTLEVDTETCLTAEGLITAIRRILQSISGKHQDIYPNLAVILHQPILEALNDPRAVSVEEALLCLAELIYN
jgi:hypothetical protein